MMSNQKLPQSVGVCRHFNKLNKTKFTSGTSIHLALHVVNLKVTCYHCQCWTFCWFVSQTLFPTVAGALTYAYRVRQKPNALLTHCRKSICAQCCFPPFWKGKQRSRCPMNFKYSTMWTLWLQWVTTSKFANITLRMSINVFLCDYMYNSTDDCRTNVYDVIMCCAEQRSVDC